MERIQMVKLIDFYRENGYEVGGPLYHRINRLFRDNSYPIYAPTPKCRYISEEIAEEILADFPPPDGAPTIEHEMAEDTSPTSPFDSAIAGLRAGQDQLSARIDKILTRLDAA